MLTLTLIRNLLRLRRDEGGSPVIEFAFAAPIFFLMVSATIEFGLVMFVTVLMESSLRDASRYGVTGQMPDGASTMAEREQHIRDMIKKRTLGLVDFDDAKIDILSYPTFEDIGEGEDYTDANSNGKYDTGETFKDCNANGKRDDDRGSEGVGGSGAVVLYKMQYDWPLLTPMAAPLIGKDGKFALQASIAVRNEPWNPNLTGKEPEACTL